ncbi:beta-methylgalactoside transporter [Erysipelotrichaceae bacterium OH741_COT-311]|nr:beta-methylgalactoside transporter [Erysipelotrichaceae bacterium]RRC94264.1 beta-methylgalactoside transporter [Erysipelotrichaceae bacterium OH741_COT-311]
MNTKKLDFKKIDNVLNFMGNNAIVILLALVVIFVSITKKGFFTESNFQNIAINVAPRYLIALGVSGALITKGTDLSAGRLVGLGAVLASTLLQSSTYSNRMWQSLPELPIVAVLLIVVLVCALFGLLNGLVISYLNVPPFLATLGMQTIVYGINLVYSKAEPIGGLRDDYKAIATGGYGIFKNLFIIAIIVGLIFWFLYNKTRYGKYMYAIGGNEHAAEVSGVNTVFTKLKIYALAGTMYGLAGFLLASKAGGASVNLGLGYELEAIAACTIGGVSTSGGVGKVQGILVGVLVFELMKTSMQYLQINTSYQYIVQGIVIIVAVAIDIRKYTKKK